jgi:hypothetical protein
LAGPDLTVDGVAVGGDEYLAAALDRLYEQLVGEIAATAARGGDTWRNALDAAGVDGRDGLAGRD